MATKEKTEAEIEAEEAAAEAAIEARISRAVMGATKGVKQEVAALKAELGEAIKALKGATPGQQPAGDEGGTVQERDTLKTLRGELEAVKKENKARAESEAKKDAALRAQREDAALTSAFQKHGVDPKKHDVLLDHFRARGRVKSDEGGRVLFVDPSKEFDNEVDPEKGIGEWIKTEAGKGFLPARKAGGGGSGLPAGRDPDVGGGEEWSNAQLGAELAKSWGR